MVGKDRRVGSIWSSKTAAGDGGLGWGEELLSLLNAPRGELWGSTSKESPNPWRRNAQEMGSEGPPLSLRKWEWGVGVIERLSERGLLGFPSNKLLDGSSTPDRPSGGPVAGGVRIELVGGGEVGRSSGSVRSSSAALSGVSVGAVIALTCKGSAGRQRSNQKRIEVEIDRKTYHKLS